jgi:hypothetical protein
VRLSTALDLIKNRRMLIPCASLRWLPSAPGALHMRHVIALCWRKPQCSRPHTTLPFLFSLALLYLLLLPVPCYFLFLTERYRLCLSFAYSPNPAVSHSGRGTFFSPRRPPRKRRTDHKYSNTFTRSLHVVASRRAYFLKILSIGKFRV